MVGAQEGAVEVLTELVKGAEARAVVKVLIDSRED